MRSTTATTTTTDTDVTNTPPLEAAVAAVALPPPPPAAAAAAAVAAAPRNPTQPLTEPAPEIRVAHCAVPLLAFLVSVGVHRGLLHPLLVLKDFHHAFLGRRVGDLDSADNGTLADPRRPSLDFLHIEQRRRVRRGRGLWVVVRNHLLEGARLAQSGALRGRRADPIGHQLREGRWDGGNPRR